MFAIVANNCWGAGLYQERRLVYNTPFIGLFVRPSHYISLLTDLRYHLKQEINFTNRLSDTANLKDKYPIGILSGSIEIHFLHYNSVADAEYKWNSRLSRLPACDDDLYLKICDRDGFEQEHLDAFCRLPFKNKVAYVKKGRFATPAYPWVIEIQTPRVTMPPGVDLWRKTKDRPDFPICNWVGLEL